MYKYLHVLFNLPVRHPFTYLLPEGEAAEAGCRVKAPLGKRNLTGFIVEISSQKPAGNFACKPVEKVVDREPIFGRGELELAAWISDMYFCSKGEALAAILPGGIQKSRLPLEPFEYEKPEKVALSREQEEGARRILEQKKGMFYLFGITGSGKTEVYLTVAEQLIKNGKDVIYLVPEIALSHQIMKEVRNRFGDRAALVHSGLTQAQRMEEWKRIRNGEAKLVVGARSAVFAPVRDLGLIVLDEEHEGTYKSGSTPRYHARQVAMYRSMKAGGALVMGSATPSVEAYHLMTMGKITRIDLTKRPAGGTLPKLSIVDLNGEQGGISARLAEEIAGTLAKKRQVILFLNRRGFSYFFHCRTCGFEMKCSHCSVALTYHKQHGRMICHYCGYSTLPVEVCPGCGSLDVGYSGFGTEKVEEDIARLFPKARIGRVDTDSVRRRGILKKILEDFASGELDILLGTQMVAKGLNFPGVDLVGIILADTGLSLPDFRAAERTFQLITQVSGRAGRFDAGGKVIIQTFRPSNPAISRAKEGDIESFIKDELENRQMLGFPPFSRLFRFVFRGKKKEVVFEFSRKTASELSQNSGPGDEILGPAECPLATISGNHRFQLILKTRSFSAAHKRVGRLMKGFKPPAGVYVELDVDPVSLL